MLATFAGQAQPRQLFRTFSQGSDADQSGLGIDIASHPAQLHAMHRPYVMHAQTYPADYVEQLEMSPTASQMLRIPSEQHAERQYAPPELTASAAAYLAALPKVAHAHPCETVDQYGRVWSRRVSVVPEAVEADFAGDEPTPEMVYSTSISSQYSSPATPVDMAMLQSMQLPPVCTPQQKSLAGPQRTTDDAKRKDHLERNRNSARRSREKKKAQEVQLEIDANALGEANTQLQELIESLRDEVRSLRSVVDMHQKTQCCAGPHLDTQYGQEEEQ